MRNKLKRDLEEFKELFRKKENFTRQKELVSQIKKLAELLDCAEEIGVELFDFVSMSEKPSLEVRVEEFSNCFVVSFPGDTLPSPIQVKIAIKKINADFINNITELGQSTTRNILKITSIGEKPLILTFENIEDLSQKDFKDFYEELADLLGEHI